MFLNNELVWSLIKLYWPLSNREIVFLSIHIQLELSHDLYEFDSFILEERESSLPLTQKVFKRKYTGINTGITLLS